MLGHTWNEDVGHSRTAWTERLFEICEDAGTSRIHIAQHWSFHKIDCLMLTLKGCCIVLPQAFTGLIHSMPGVLGNNDIIYSLTAYIERRARYGKVSRQHQEDP